MSLAVCRATDSGYHEFCVLVLEEAKQQCSGINDWAVTNGRYLSQLMVACYHGKTQSRVRIKLHQWDIILYIGEILRP